MNLKENKYNPIKYTSRNISEISKLIKSYSSLYSMFENFQSKNHVGKGLLPVGDQKTGVIGEFYAANYIQNKYKVKTVYSVSCSEYDIEFIYKGKLKKIQVKAVSHYSKTRRISPLGNDAWDELYLISLDKNFVPEGFWINMKEDINFEGKDVISYITMPKLNSIPKKGKLNFLNNQIKDFIKFQNF